jgi:predicted house-cleaning noncanonical NTP pyrophosphatase (MazG superfamily)
MPRFIPIKLVRDKVADPPAMCVVKPMHNKKGIDLLRRKLVEEAIEYLLNPCVEELADVMEVVETLAHYDPKITGGYNGANLLKEARARKNAKNGSFSDMVVLGVEVDD